MKRITQITIYFTFLLLILIPTTSLSQISTVEGFNYYDINKNAFTIDYSCFNGTEAEKEEKGYYFTSFQLAETLKTVFISADENINLTLGNYIIQKRGYLDTTLADENFRWILIRPNDEVIRPTVHITHGGQTSGANPMRVLSLGVYDYVQRGYAVVYYQSGSYDGNKLQALADAGVDAICADTLLCNWSPDCDIDCFQQAVYLKSQFTTSALDFSAANSQQFYLDSDLFFAQAFSGGAVGTLTSTLADSNNFTDPLFVNMGQLNRLSIDTESSYQLKAITTLAGGILDESSTNYSIGPLIDASDNNTRFLLFHGQDDYAVQPETSPLLWADPQKELPGSLIMATLDLKEKMDEFGITNKAIINCSACHDIFTFPCDYKDDCLGNNPLFQPAGLDICLLWLVEGNAYSLDYSEPCNSGLLFDKEVYYVMDQIHDYCKIGAYFYHEDFENSGPSSPEDELISTLLSSNNTEALNPTDFPFNEGQSQTNGHLIQSDKCLQQNCTALYFDRQGTQSSSPFELGLGYRGDYATIPAFESNIFNQDFTIEMTFKAIDHIGVGTLFSLMDNFFSGIEIFITPDGYLRFQKTVGNAASITGDIDVRDGNCHQVVLTRSGNLFGLYLDGELQEIKKTYNITLPNTQKYRIGNSLKEIDVKGFNGVIRNLKFWTSEIPESDFGQNDLVSSTLNLLSEWKFDEKVGQELISTNATYLMIIGNSIENASYDPRWMKNDKMCSCDSDDEVGVDQYIMTQGQSTVYPNPSSGNFTIKSKDQLANISIYNAQGKLVFSEKMRSLTTKIKIESKGIYVLKAQKSDSIESFKLIVQ